MDDLHPHIVVEVKGMMSDAGRAIVDRCFRPHAHWKLASRTLDGGAWTRWLPQQGELLSVIASMAVEADGQPWLHLSVAGRRELPDYYRLCEIKDEWAGPAAKAIEVHAPAAEHVNIHPLCRHLWVCLGADPLPDFTRGGRTI